MVKTVSKPQATKKKSAFAPAERHIAIILYILALVDSFKYLSYSNVTYTYVFVEIFLIHAPIFLIASIIMIILQIKRKKFDIHTAMTILAIVAGYFSAMATGNPSVMPFYLITFGLSCYFIALALTVEIKKR